MPREEPLPIRTIIVDDEVAARRGMRLLLDRHPEIEVVRECTDGSEGITAVRDLEPDLLLLDIQMPVMDGFEMLRRLGSEGVPAVVFITAYDEYALRAFDVNAVDYLLKPYSDDRFDQALARAKAVLAQPRLEEFRARLEHLLAEVRLSPGRSGENVASPPGTPGPVAVVRRGNRSTIVRLREVEWISAEGDYVGLHVGEDRYLHRETMSHMEHLLRGERFVRIHRSSIVRLDFVAEVRPYGGGRYEAVLGDGTVRRISAAGRARLERALGTAF